MEQNIFDALARGYLAFSLSHFLCCYVSQKTFRWKERKKGNFVVSYDLALVRVCLLALRFFYSQKDDVVFHAGVLAFCSVSVCCVSVVLVPCCCFSSVVFLCFISSGIRYCADFRLGFVLLSVFRCCFSLLFSVCFLSEMCCVSQALFVKMLKTM